MSGAHESPTPHYAPSFISANHFDHCSYLVHISVHRSEHLQRPTMMGRDVTVGAASLIINGSGIYAVLLTSTVLDGLLARSRINYLPKRVSLVSSEKGEVECSPRIPGLFHVLRRVRKLEVSSGAMCSHCA